jgi:isochorismate hydrolase
VLRGNQLDVDRAGVVLIDLQEKLLPLIRGRDRIVAGVRKLLAGVRVFQLPVLATEQYVKGLGGTEPTVAAALAAGGATVIEKVSFSACGESTVRDALLAIDRPQVILAGIETHVCVQQTALDLKVMDYDVFVCADALGSRGANDHEQALARMRQDGVVVTTVESVLFELCGQCDTDRFRAMLEVIKSHPPAE